MDVREKLVGLLNMCVDDNIELDDGFVGYGVNYANMADYLIAHGVTVREWIPTSERLPEELGIFEVMDATKGTIGFAGFKPDKKLFEVFPSQDFVNHVSHWRYVKAKGYYHRARARGWWIWKDGKCFCSACLKQGDPKHRYEDGTVEEYDFCPSCGAIMDLEGE